MHVNARAAESHTPILMEVRGLSRKVRAARHNRGDMISGDASIP